MQCPQWGFPLYIIFLNFWVFLSLNFFLGSKILDTYRHVLIVSTRVSITLISLVPKPLPLPISATTLQQAAMHLPCFSSKAGATGQVGQVGQVLA